MNETRVYEYNTFSDKASWVEKCCARFEKTTIQDVNVNPVINIVFDDALNPTSIITKEIDNYTFTFNYSGTYRIQLNLTGDSNNSSILFSIPEFGFEYIMLPTFVLGSGGEFSFQFSTCIDVLEDDSFHLEAGYIDNRLNILDPIESMNIGNVNNNLSQIQIMKI